MLGARRPTPVQISVAGVRVTMNQRLSSTCTSIESLGQHDQLNSVYYTIAEFMIMSNEKSAIAPIVGAPNALGASAARNRGYPVSRARWQARSTAAKVENRLPRTRKKAQPPVPGDATAFTLGSRPERTTPAIADLQAYSSAGLSRKSHGRGGLDVSSGLPFRNLPGCGLLSIGSAAWRSSRDFCSYRQGASLPVGSTPPGNQRTGVGPTLPFGNLSTERFTNYP
jgi:hypothetical protein